MTKDEVAVVDECVRKAAGRGGIVMSRPVCVHAGRNVTHMRYGCDGIWVEDSKEVLKRANAMLSERGVLVEGWFNEAENRMYFSGRQ